MQNPLIKATSILFLVLLVFSCTTEKRDNYESFGSLINEDDAIALSSLEIPNSSDSVEIKLTATIEEVCQMKGCWMTLKTETGVPVRVTFKNYGFFVPKDASGKKVVLQGVMTKAVMDRETAEHYAEDAGKELPEDSDLTEMSIVASGVLIEKQDQL